MRGIQEHEKNVATRHKNDILSIVIKPKGYKRYQLKTKPKDKEKEST